MLKGENKLQNVSHDKINLQGIHCIWFIYFHDRACTKELETWN